MFLQLRDVSSGKIIDDDDDKFVKYLNLLSNFIQYCWTWNTNSTMYSLKIDIDVSI